MHFKLNDENIILRQISSLKTRNCLLYRITNKNIDVLYGNSKLFTVIKTLSGIKKLKFLFFL